MKFLKKFNENIESELLEPIDVSADVIEFRDKFLKVDRKLSEKEESTLNRVNRMLSELEAHHPTMTDKYEIYQVYSSNHDINNIVYVKAVSHAHAFIKASIELNKAEIVYHRLGMNKTDRWKGITLKMDQVKTRISEYELQLSKLKNIK